MAAEERKKEEKGRFIAERRYVDDQRIVEPEKLEAGGVDMSGRWGTLVLPRTIEEFDHSLFEGVKRLPRGGKVGKCWQCGNCTAVCPVAHANPMFNPRYLIHIVRMGYQAEIEKVKDYVYLCSGCGLCSAACPKDVDPQGVMIALSIAFKSGRAKGGR
ncbi:MAG: 4Fe-4S dicluster domain-containing protein [Nitrososphaerota archaeon]|nr:4Fe-4S dicluster domain-containing protein [Nitrososphaerota archaeon]MDG6939640.1 4Fe-4S dicluster domain-containing protein [Nitrososphaerota archaeon]